MSKSSEKTVNLGYNMRPVIIKAYELGNKKVISQEMCSLMGVSDSDYKYYRKSMDNLHKAMVEFSKSLHGQRDKDRIEEARNKAYAAWKGVFQHAEKDKDTNAMSLVTQESDLYDLMSVAQKLVQDDVNLDLDDDEFTAKYQWVTVTPSAFIRQAEKIMGIMVNKVENMSDDKYLYLRTMNSIMGKIRHLTDDIKKMNEQLGNFDKLIATAASADFKKYLNENKEKLVSDIKSKESNLKSQSDLKEKYSRLVTDNYAEVAEAIRTDKKANADVKKAKAKAKTEDAKQSEQDAEKAEAKTKEAEVKTESPSKTKTSTKSKTTKSKTATKVA